jgi:tetratricopeptide (TPR) repeat protein
MGTAYYWRGDNAKAVEAYERAIKLSPNRPDPYANLGDALTKLGKKDRATENYRHAIEQVEKLLAVKSNDPLNLASLALFQAKLGQRAAAEASIARAIGLSAQDGEVLYVRAVLFALGGNTAAACTAIDDALAHGKSAIEVRYADELRPLKGCPAYDRLVGPGK